MAIFGNIQGIVMSVLEKVGYMAVFLIVAGIMMGLYMWWSGKKEYSIDIGIHKRIGNGTVYLQDTAKQTKDSKGTIIFKSRKYDIELPAVDSRYFILSSLGAGRRYINFWEPMPGVFLPMDTDFIKLHDKDVVLKSQEECLYCVYGRKCVKDKKTINFKSPDFLEDVVGKVNEIKICNNHLSKVYTAKYKIMSEVEKEWMFTRAKERILRAVTDRPWYDKPVVAGGMIIIGALVFVIIIMKFGKEWFADAMHESAEASAKVFIELTKGALPPPPN